ncbi:hypothetical protein BRC97_04165 [Halobacteriales archaeon QS_6_71_20]|nr:MAG: hypothetical protein BRC97_04165 [Halobacteriales archaeon QS_6_71_20]
MGSTDRAESGTSRRDVLGGMAGALGVGVGAGTTAARATAAAPTVLTQNLYLGVDFTRLLGAASYREFRRTVGDILAGIDPETYRARVDAVAATVETHAPDVIALQEASLFRTQEPGDFASPDGARASTVVVDILAAFEAALRARGLNYRRAAVTTTSDAELPATTDDGPVDFRVTDRVALLVRDGVDATDVVADTYDADISVPVPNANRTVALRRGYCRATVTVGETTFTAVSTHLESVSSFFRVLQARELLAALPDDGAVVLGGDFNSGPDHESSAYDLLTESFRDPYARLRPDTAGHTCCQAPDLRNDRSRLNRRIDAVLCRGGVRATDVGRVNHREADRRTVSRGSRTVSLWPSDHAGVVATFEGA